MNKKKFIIVSVLFFIALIGTVTILFALYFSSQNKQLTYITKLIISEDAASNSREIKNNLELKVNSLRSISDIISSSDMDLFSAPKTLSEYRKIINSERLVYVDKDGNSIDDTGKPENYSSSEIFTDAINGDIIINSDKKDTFIFSLPVSYGGEIIGVIISYSDKDDFFPDDYNMAQSRFIITEKGNIIAKHDPSDKTFTDDNVFNNFTPETISSVDFNDFKQNIDSGRSGIVKYHSANEDYYLLYEPIGFDNWYLVTSITNEEVFSITKSTVSTAFTFSFCIILIFLAIATFEVYSNYYHRKVVLQLNNAISVEDAKYNTVSSFSDDIIFEYNINTNKINYLGKNKNSYMELLENSSKEGLEKFIDIIHDNDKEAVLNAFDAVLSDKKSESIDYKVITNDNKYKWYKLSLKKYTKDDILGKIKNIDLLKRDYGTLPIRAAYDPLTKLYNKETAVELIKWYLATKEDDKLSALLLIDIDDFKNINASKGHLLGDSILIELSKFFKKEFRSSDIVSRIGGDEFMIFVKGIGTVENARRKAKAVNSIFEKCMFETGQNVNISGSIGLVFYPLDGLKYEELYDKAASALKKAKTKGKNRYVIYGNDFEEEIHKEEQPVPAAKLNDSLNPPLSSEIFNMLYFASSAKHVMPQILQLIASVLNVDRAYIVVGHIEKPESIYFYAYERPNIPSCGNFLEECIDRDYCMLDYKNTNYFYCSKGNFPVDFSEMFDELNIKALINTYIYDSDEFMGILGVDDCKKKRYWNKDELDSLSLIAKIISVFLYRKPIKKL
ncbi:MAG: diguanylate cyclase [Firmicutes bacterium]|nr:diguanylate cyclase [Bacillota bacterium]